MENTPRATTDSNTLNKRRYICGVCGISRSKRSLIDLHMKTHSDCHAKFLVEGKDQRCYTCAFCGIKRSKLSLLRKHMECHLDQDWGKAETKCSLNPEMLKDWLFEMCGLSAPSSTQKSCILNHSEKKLFSCTVDSCNKCYKRRYHLKRHLLRHEGVVFPCPWEGCVRECSSLSNLRRHLKLHARKGGAGLLEHGRREKKVFQCSRPECGKSFSYSSQLRHHEENVHVLDYTDIICGEPGCGLHFSQVALLKEHVKCAHKYINCSICGASSLRRCYKRHLQIHEPESDSSEAKKRIHCMMEGCKLSYASTSSLIQHLKVAHHNLKPYKCSFEGCHMTFGYKHVKDNHELRKHYYKQGNFYEEDKAFCSHPRGGRKPVSLEKVEDLFRKRITSTDPSSCVKGFSYEEWVFLSKNHAVS